MTHEIFTCRQYQIQEQEEDLEAAREVGKEEGATPSETLDLP